MPWLLFGGRLALARRVRQWLTARRAAYLSNQEQALSSIALRSWRPLFAIAAIALSSASFGQTPAITPLSDPNSCGSGWNTWLVPDSIPILNCQFKSSCDSHDLCYGKCEGRAKDTSAPECAYVRCRKGGDLFRSEMCETDVLMMRSLVAAKVRRDKCDTSFYSVLRSSNQGKPVCEALAIVYRDAVKALGWDSFQGIDPTGKIVYQTEDEYNAAIRKFFLRGTEAEFRAFVSSADRGKPSVSLGAPLKYVPGQGLQNKPNVRSR